MKRELLVLLLLIQLYNDRKSVLECKCYVGKALIVMHHALQMYILFGGYIWNSKLHLVVLVTAFTVHYMNNRLCPITVVHNRMCGYPEDKQLQTTLNVLEPNRNRVICVYYFLLTLALLYDFKRI
jgi:hypothetical protein